MQLRCLDSVLPHGGHGRLDVEGGRQRHQRNQKPQRRESGTRTKTPKTASRDFPGMELEGYRCWGSEVGEGGRNLTTEWEADGAELADPQTDGAHRGSSLTSDSPLAIFLDPLNRMN